ncbi:MAG: preprotein translocase subunit YajC [Chlamydiales bacterium]
MIKKIIASFLLFSSSFSLFAGEETPQNPSSFWQTLIMVAVAVVFFYFILWRPEQKRRKSMEKKRSAMKKGDKVTAMGIIGTIDRLKEQTVVLKMVDGSKIEVIKGAITEVKAKESQMEEESTIKAEESSS